MIACGSCRPRSDPITGDTMEYKTRVIMLILLAIAVTFLILMNVKMSTCESACYARCAGDPTCIPACMYMLCQKDGNR